MARNPYGQFEWDRRRRIIYGTLIFCLLSSISIQVAAHFGVDTALLNTIAAANYTLAGATITSYVFGAVVDDKSARETGVAVEVAAASPSTPAVTINTAPEGEAP